MLGSEQGAAAALLVIVAALAVWPITRLVIEGLAPGGRFDPGLLGGVLTTKQNWVAAEHTLVTALFGTAISLLLGAPAALLLALTDLRGKAALVFAFMLPLLIPPQIIAVAWIELIGPASPLLRPLGLAPAAGTPHPLFGLGGISLLLGIEHGPLVFLALSARLRARPLTPGGPPPPFFLGAARPVVEIAVWLGIAVPVMMPLAALLATSLVRAYGVPLSPATATLENSRYVIFAHDAARRAAVNSLALAGGAALLLAVIALPFGYFIAWRRSTAMRILGVVAEWPYALPGVVLAIAFILVLIHPLPLLGLSLYNTIWILLVAYLARFLTLSLRTVTAGYLQLDRTLDEAAQMAGAGFLRRLRDVIAPPLAPVLVAGGIVVFLTALNELTLSILLWSSGNETLGIVVFSLEQGGDNLSAAALAMLTVVATLVIMLLAGRLAAKLPRGALPWQV